MFDSKQSLSPHTPSAQHCSTDTESLPRHVSETQTLSWVSTTLPALFWLWSGMKQWRVRVVSSWRQRTPEPATCWHSRAPLRVSLAALIVSAAVVLKRSLSLCVYSPNRDRKALTYHPAPKTAFKLLISGSLKKKKKNQSALSLKRLAISYYS